MSSGDGSVIGRGPSIRMSMSTVTHVYCLWLQEVIHLKIWTSFGWVLEKGRGMGTDRGVLGGGCVREVEVVARGTQSKGDDSFLPCCMKAVRGNVYARTTTLGSTRCAQCMWQLRTSMECRGPRSVRMRLAGGHPQYCHRDDALEQED
jgi:hypothetical protein